MKKTTASYKNPKAKTGPECDCDPLYRVISKVTWRPWGGTKWKVRCQACKREWPKQ